MLQKVRTNKKAQLWIGLAIGVFFGFLLQRSSVTRYDTILNQLLLIDFTVVKVMLTAVIVGMLGVHLMRSLGWIRLQPKPGSVGKSIVGGLIFGVAFAVLGYCPGTIVGGIAQGALDALTGGLIGVLFGSWLFAVFYPKLQKPVLLKGDFGEVTLPQLLRVNAWAMVIPIVILLTALLLVLESVGL
jgi:uncharacterized membrane protein YedE/YeeE